VDRSRYFLIEVFDSDIGGNNFGGGYGIDILSLFPKA
jgi:hypothetical protein